MTHSQKVSPSATSGNDSIPEHGFSWSLFPHTQGGFFLGHIQTESLVEPTQPVVASTPILPVLAIQERGFAVDVAGLVYICGLVLNHLISISNVKGVDTPPTAYTSR